MRRTLTSRTALWPRIRPVADRKAAVLAWKAALAAVPFERSKNRKKHTLWAKQHGLCAYCDTPFGRYEDATLDHIKPKSAGGSNRMENLALVCMPCNWLKANFASYAEAEAFANKLLGFFERLRERGYVR